MRTIRGQETTKLEKLNHLLVFDGILADTLLQSALHAVQSLDDRAIYAFLRSLIVTGEEKGLSGAIFNQLLAGLLLDDENIFSRRAEHGWSIGESLQEAVLHDLDIVIKAFGIDWSEIIEPARMPSAFDFPTKYRASYEDDSQDGKLRSKIIKAKAPAELMEILQADYESMGCGIMRNNRMLRVMTTETEDVSLCGIKNADNTTFDDLIGCDIQKEILVNNTEGFLNGLPANNVLLIGARGTGKSSCVKALVNEYFSRGLRLIEISRDQITMIQPLMEKLMNRGKRFIIFIDDLSFDESETQYKLLKSVLEGGTIKKPDNILFYATSNRRHIIQEKFSDRDSSLDNHMNDEIHGSDTANEKISLSDRFGINIVFPTPNQTQYLNILKGIAIHRGVTLTESDIKDAVAWELNQKGRSGRAARQFIDDLLLRRAKSN